jgi:hypothetical protein
MSKRQSRQEAIISRLLSIINFSASPADVLPEAVRKALLAAFLEGYSAGLQDNILQGRSQGP